MSVTVNSSVPVNLKSGETDSTNYSDAPIQRVVLYRNGAELTRIWKKSIHGGLHHVRFSSFPQKYASGSLSVRIDGPAVIKEVCETAIVSSECVPHFEGHPRSGQAMLEVNKKRDELKLQLDFLGKRLETWEAYRQVVMGKATSPPIGIFKEGAFTDLHDFLWKYEGEYIRLNVAIDQLKENLRVLEASATKKRPDLSNLSDLIIILEADGPCSVSLTLTYSIFTVEWKPQYDLRFRLSDNSMELTYCAWILQWTGEDWSPEQMVVSTGLLPQPSMNVTESITLHASNGKSSADLRKGSEKIPSSNQSKMMEHTEVEAVDIEIEMPMLLAHERAIRLNLMTFRFEYLELTYKCCPRNDLSVSLTARFSNQAPWSILPGKASVFLDGHFVLNTSLNLTPQFESIEVPLGRQTSVHVKRKPPQKSTKPITPNAGLDDGNIQVEAEYSQEWEIKNDRKQPIAMVLLDDLPTSNDPRIKITVVHPKVTKTELDSGYTKHRLDIAPCSTRTIKSIYKVEHPNKLPHLEHMSRLPSFAP